MSINNFISYLQQLLTMVDPNSAESIALAQKALDATVKLAMTSGKVNRDTATAMYRAQNYFVHLVENAEDFAGKPGRFQENEQKRHRLERMLVPHC